MFQAPASAPAGFPAGAPIRAPVGAPVGFPAERLADILEMLCRAVADCGGRKLLGALLVVLIWTRLRRLSTRVLRLAARIEAGAPPAKPRRGRAPRPPPLRLPRGKAWLVRLMRVEAAAAGSQLQHLLNHPDMRALAAADPRMGRLLRPGCHMLGVPPTPEIAKPARSIPPAPAAAEPAQPPEPPASEPPAPAPRAPAPPAQIIPSSSCKRRRAGGGMRRTVPSHGPGPPPAPG